MTDNAPRDLQLSFAGAGEQVHQMRGRYVRVLRATNDVYLRLDGGSEVRRRVGQAIRTRGEFSRIGVRSTVAQDVQLVVADDPQDDNSQELSASVSATIGPGNTLTNTPDVSVAATTTSQVIAGRADRLTVIVKNLASNTDPVRVGDSTTGAASGHELMPGESVALDTTSTVYVYNAKAGGAQSVSVTEVRAV